MEGGGDDDDDGKESYQVPWTEGEVFNEFDHLVPEARTYHKSTTVLKLNHPLMIMVKEGRTVKA